MSDELLHHHHLSADHILLELVKDNGDDNYYRRTFVIDLVSTADL